MNQGQDPTDLVIYNKTHDLVDHHGVYCKLVHRTAYLIHQHLRYEYPGPIYDLKQRLVILPPDHYGNQRRVVHRLEVSSDHFELSTENDGYGNVVLKVYVPVVEQAIDFEVWIVAERQASGGPLSLPISTLSDGRYLEASKLTQPDDKLCQAAIALMADGIKGSSLAQKISDWVHANMHYAHDVTSIHTTASEALALGRGVCQDYAHIMLTLCHLCGLPARYVSGHLLGEGGTHAWVEVLLPADDHSDQAIALPFDPTNGSTVGLNYLTIAVGRNYYDGAPTSGTFRASYRGHLLAHKRVGLTMLEYTDTAVERDEKT